MNKISKITLIIFIFIITFVGISNANTVIEQEKKASLTIILNENKNGVSQYTPLQGAEFSIYKIDNNIETTSEAEEYIENNDIENNKKTTGENGEAKFENLELGRYLVVETVVPKHATNKVDAFLVDLPRTQDNGNGWNYDVIVYPKSITVYGKATVFYCTGGNEDGVEGGEWKIEKKENNKWQSYRTEQKLITNEQGNFTIEGLEK